MSQLEFDNDFSCLLALFQCNQYRSEAQDRYDAAKRDLKDAKEVQAHLLKKIDRYVPQRKMTEARTTFLDAGTSADGLRQLRESLGMDEFGAKKPPEEAEE